MEYVLIHHGIKGQKWGIRRYQNEDGSLTPDGIKRYAIYDRAIRRSKEEEKRIMAAREKNRGKIESRYNKKIGKIDNDIKSFDPIKKGLYDDKARLLLSESDVASSIKALNEKKEKLKTKRDPKIKDFDNYTKSLSRGYKEYNSIIQNYGTSKIKAFEDRAYKKSPEYKAAVMEYVGQLALCSYYGYRGAVISDYASRDYNANYRNKKTKKRV